VVSWERRLAAIRPAIISAGSRSHEKLLPRRCHFLRSRIDVMPDLINMAQRRFWAMGRFRLSIAGLNPTIEHFSFIAILFLNRYGKTKTCYQCRILEGLI
jgi:hypothetical protein